MPSQSPGGVTQPDDTDPLADIALAVRTVVGEVGDPWISYAGTFTFTGTTTNPTLGNSTVVAKYRRIGKTVHVRIKIIVGSTFAAGSGNYRFSLPFAMHADMGAWDVIGHGSLQDASVPARYGRHVAHSGASTVVMLIDDSGAQVTSASPFAPAAGDVYFLAFTYEAA